MKIGIITFYNGNINHGGMLQAYALQKTIENLGYDCEQICLDNRITEKLSFKDKVKLVFKLKFGVFNLIKRKLYAEKLYQWTYCRCCEVNMIKWEMTYQMLKC